MFLDDPDQITSIALVGEGSINGIWVMPGWCQEYAAGGRLSWILGVICHMPVPDWTGEKQPGSSGIWHTNRRPARGSRKWRSGVLAPPLTKYSEYAPLAVLGWRGPSVV